MKKKVTNLIDYLSRAGVGQLRPAKGNSVAREHVDLAN